MATPQLSPGVLTREVDLTVGRAENVLDNIGAIAGPFTIGPVNDPVDIATEQDLINVFGKPQSTSAQYEYWMSAASYLTYGGVLKVVRTAGPYLANANAGVGIASTSMTGSGRIDNYDDYINNHDDATDFTFAAKNPGSWANDLKVTFIDDFADQILHVNTTDPAAIGCTIGYGVTAPINGVIAGLGTTTQFSGYLKGIIVGVNTDSSTAANSTIDVRIVSRVSGFGTETMIDYSEDTVGYAFTAGNYIKTVNNSAAVTGTGFTPNLSSGIAEPVKDWYDQQTLGLTNASISWKEIAGRPTTTKYCLDRDSKNDACHIVVTDDTGKITGIQGNVIEKHLNLSKALDAVSAVNAPTKNWYEQYIADFSDNVYAGGNPGGTSNTYSSWESHPRASTFSSTTDYTPVGTAAGTWGIDAQGVNFNVIGNKTYTLSGGDDYSVGGSVVSSGSTFNGFSATLGDLMTSYNEFSNKDEIEVDFLIMGPGGDTVQDSQAKANKLISLANSRKDCVATVGPHRADLVGVTNATTQTNNLVQYFASLSSSSYAVFDSGYKYTYDRFNNKFRYIPTNADVAGLMCRTAITSYPWFSPAGQQRGIINNAIKLAYNPDKAQRDILYPKRVNSVITQPGIGTLLFGDKTGLGYASAFDRINVRRLFLTIEQALQKAAEAQLFELNDELTRANFRNIVEPYLRDVQAKRGLYGFLVICDTTNNTPDVIDNNEFRADIYLKPAKSINYVTLTFIATRTGVSFEEVAGRA